LGKVIMKKAGNFPVIMRFTGFYALLVFMPLLPGLSGCGGGPEELPAYERKSPASGSASTRRISADRPQLVGKVSLINTEDEFVLIEMQTPRIPAPGMLLTARDGQMKTARLKVSNEERRPFIIADIQEGLPGQEDQVFLEPSPNPIARSGGGSSGNSSAYTGEADLPTDWDEPIPELELLSAEEAQGRPVDGDEEIRVIVDPQSEAPLFETGGL
jgi:hypothetical protein